MPDDTDLYGDTGSPAEVPAEAESGEEVSEGPQTALIPKSFFPDEPTVGKVCKIRVEQVMEDQVSVSYDKSEPGAEDAEQAAPATADEEMQSYMT